MYARMTASVGVGGLACGLMLGWMLWRPKPRPVETYAPAIIQKDGSLILERKPDPKAKPEHEVPAGTVVERIMEVTISPREIPALVPPGVTVQPCPPMRLELSLIRLKDGTRRVIASSHDGEISGVDIPVESAAPVKMLRNAAGASYYPGERTYGLWIERDFGPTRMGAEIRRLRTPNGSMVLDTGIRVGIRW